MAAKKTAQRATNAATKAPAEKAVPVDAGHRIAAAEKPRSPAP